MKNQAVRPIWRPNFNMCIDCKNYYIKLRIFDLTLWESVLGLWLGTVLNKGDVLAPFL